MFTSSCRDPVLTEWTCEINNPLGGCSQLSVLRITVSVGTTGSSAAAHFGFRMKVAVLLLLFFCPSPADTQGGVDGFTLQEDTRKDMDVPLTLSGLWDELKGLKELVLSLRAAEVEQRLALRAMETRLRDREVEAEEHRGRVRALEEALSEHREELRSTEVRMDTGPSLLTERNSALARKVEELEKHSAIQVTELLILKSRLNNSSILIENLENMNTALMAELPFLQLRLRTSESTVEQLRVKTSGLATRMCKAEGLLEELKMPNLESKGSVPTDISELETRLKVHLEEVTRHRGAVHSRLDSLEEEVNKSPGNSIILSRLSSVENGLKEGDRRLAELMTECRAQSANLSRLENGLSVSQRRLDDLRTEFHSSNIQTVGSGERRDRETQRTGCRE
ncbi:uncharacterized protein LOC117531707 isoform X1 [Thalassophryne amazonica]|uniref:uncharacterized protein LOC117531707 isoform X1 n=1 Tax=Thalassophryne amazonica TaxID=390379 RepID=UPI0014725DC6|nr:uncharacterized protein LOC117531707 isoform X1 [Thalassophryne amazonica]